MGELNWRADEEVSEVQRAWALGLRAEGRGLPPYYRISRVYRRLAKRKLDFVILGTGDGDRVVMRLAEARDLRTAKALAQKDYDGRLQT